MENKIPLILCIDDDADTLNLQKYHLKSANYEVMTASEGRRGIQLATANQPDVIVLDVEMRGLNGYEVCLQLQKDPITAYIPVVFVTSKNSEQDKIKAFAAGGADFLTKPFHKNPLLNKIRLQLKRNVKWQQLKEPHNKMEAQPSEFLDFKEFVANKFQFSSEKKIRWMRVAALKLYEAAHDFDFEHEDIAKLIAECMNVPYIPHIKSQIIRIGVIPTAFSKSNLILAVDESGCGVSFILSNPFDWTLRDTMEKFNGVDQLNQFAVTEPDTIIGIFDRSKRKQIPVTETMQQQSIASSSSGSVLQAAQTGNNNSVVESYKNSTDNLASLSGTELLPVERNEGLTTIAKLTNKIFSSAVCSKASDIHIEPKDAKTVVRFRVDGDMREYMDVDSDIGIKLLSRLKVLGGLDIAEKRKPQDGAVEIKIDKRTFKLRLATTSTPHGESMVIRLLDPDAQARSLSELGMTEQQTATMVELTQRHSGLVLIVGPTGSGKTTTIYSLLASTDCTTRSLMTVEDPVEYKIAFANQQQVNEKAGATFEALLKSAVRQDPDMFFLGEIRDGFSAKTCMDFSSSGHLVVSTIHSSNATTTIFRLERLDVNRGAMADSVTGIVAQQLVKRLCDHCKVIEPASQEELHMLSGLTDTPPATLAHAKGCDLCGNTGYSGREGVYEIIKFDPQIVAMVREGSSIANIRQFMRNRGDFLISDHALEKVRNHSFALNDVYGKILLEESSVKAVSVKTTEPEAPVLSIAGTAGDATKSILVVDDDDASQALIEHYLAQAGYKVTNAGDGIEALLEIGQKSFDLIISDINMPNLDGFKLLEMLIQKGLHTPVIMVTGSTGPEDEIKGLELGAQDYIRKPLNKEALLFRVKKALGEHRSQLGAA